MYRWIHRIGILMLASLILCQSAFAHAILMESTPAANSSVDGSALAITLRFNVRIDGGRSRLRLVTADGSVSNLELATQTNPDSLQSNAHGLKPGAYTLRWQVLASDGHMSRGEVPFTVK